MKNQKAERDLRGEDISWGERFFYQRGSKGREMELQNERENLEFGSSRKEVV